MSKTRKDFVNKQDAMSFLDLAIDNIEVNIPAAANVKHDPTSSEATDLMRVLSKTCTTMHKLFRPELDKRDANPLLIAVLQGNEEIALKIAKANPGLFFIKATAEDYAMDLEGNKRTIKDWSPYQAMFGTGDKDMLAVVKPHLDAYLQNLKQLPKDYQNLQNGFEMAAAQEAEKFPNGFDYPPCTDEFNQLLESLADAIANDLQLRQVCTNPNPETRALLAKFREHLKPGIVQAGHHFNMNDIIKTHAIYVENWAPWSGQQLAFFNVNVFGFQERMMTAPRLQAVCMGLDSHINRKQPLKRNFEVFNWVTGKKITVAPFTSEDPSCRLGEGFLVDSCYGRGSLSLCGGDGPATLSALKNYVSKLSEAFKTYAHVKEADRQLTPM